MKLSVIIPAYNEEKLLPSCLGSVFAALKTWAAADWSAEVIVVDNNSSDRTAELARAAGAQVVFEPVNQISRARNAGARVASGDWFLFVDADSVLSAAVLGDLLTHIRKGDCAGGGCLVGIDLEALSVTIVLGIWNFLSRTLHWAAGSFVFCRREAFEAIGGFSTELYAAEELALSKGLKRWAAARELKVVILTRHRHMSSARKFHFHGFGGLLLRSLRILVRGRSALLGREHLGLFYDGRR